MLTWLSAAWSRIVVVTGTEFLRRLQKQYSDSVLIFDLSVDPYSTQSKCILQFFLPFLFWTESNYTATLIWDYASYWNWMNKRRLEELLSDVIFSIYLCLWIHIAPSLNVVQFYILQSLLDLCFLGLFWTWLNLLIWLSADLGYWKWLHGTASRDYSDYPNSVWYNQLCLHRDKFNFWR